MKNLRNVNINNLNKNNKTLYNIPNLNFKREMKRYSKIYQHLARHLKYNSASLSPFLCSQKITPFSISMLSHSQETGL